MIGRSEVYPIRPYEAPWKLFESSTDRKDSSQQTTNLQLYHRVNHDIGTSEYLVRASRDLKKGFPLCFVGGQLMEEWKTESHLIDAEGYPMKAQELHDYFDYPRDGPNLVLHMGQHYNITKFIRDPFFRRDGEGPNVAVDLILHPKAKVVVLVLFTLDNIREGDELFCVKFVGNSKKSTHQNLVLAARVSHFYHRYATELEKAAEAAGLSTKDAHKLAQQASAKKPKVLTLREQRQHMQGVDPKQKSVPPPPPASATTSSSSLSSSSNPVRSKKATAYQFFRRSILPELDMNDFPDLHARQRHISALWRSLTTEQREEWTMKMNKASGHHVTLDGNDGDDEDDGIVIIDHEDTANGATEHNDSASSAPLSESPSSIASDDVVMVSSSTSTVANPTAAVSSPLAPSPAASDLEKLSIDSPTASPSTSSSLPSSLPSSSSSSSSSSYVASTSSPSPSSSPSDVNVVDPLPMDPGTSAKLGYSVDQGQTSVQIRKELMKLMDTSAAFKNTGCEHIPRSVYGKSMDQPARIALLGVNSPQYPDVIVIDGDKYPFDVAEAERLLDGKHGYDTNKLEVREICSIASPCRYFCPPWYRSFCVVSKVALKKGELLCLYSGEMETSIQHRCSSYVYHLPTSIGVSHFGRKYSAVPDLMIDAAAKGGIGRFINDNMFRNGEYQDEAAANIGVQWFFEHMPHLVFYAKKDIGPGEELISSYGQEFWDVMCKQSLRGHSSYYHYIRPYTSALEKLLASRGVAVPSKPDVVIERDARFLPKLRPYEPPPEDSDEEEVEGKGKKKKDGDGDEPMVSTEEYIVERIVGKRNNMKSRRIEYLVKWLGYESDQNTWEPLPNLDGSQQLLADFEKRLRRRGLEFGVEPLPESISSEAYGSDDSDCSSSPIAPPKSTVRPRKLPAFRNPISTKKTARKDLTKEQLEAAPIDLTGEINANESTSSNIAAAAAATTTPSSPDAPSSLSSSSSAITPITSSSTSNVGTAPSSSSSTAGVDPTSKGRKRQSSQSTIDDMFAVKRSKAKSKSSTSSSLNDNETIDISD